MILNALLFLVKAFIILFLIDAIALVVIEIGRFIADKKRDDKK